MTDIEARLAALEARLAALEAKIAVLENHLNHMTDTNEKWFKIIMTLLLILGALVGVKVALP
ncbi:MAG: hypothetical protein QXW41_08115 [Fervidicoccaceae archaeon]